MKTSVISLLTLVLWLPLSASATDVYKWIDPDGVPTYGERPPEGIDYIKMKIYGGANNTKAHSTFFRAKDRSNDARKEPNTDKSAAKKTTP